MGSASRGFVSGVLRDKMPKNTIVCDNGTGFLKCGFAGENFPSSMFPSMYGSPIVRSEEQMLDMELKDIMVGEECQAARSNLDVKMPVSEGIVHDWDGMIHLWDHAFHTRLQVDPRDTQVLLTEAPMNPPKNREKMVQIMFEHYGFEAIHVDMQAVLVLYSQGLMSGTVLDCGDGVSHVLPVFNGFLLPTCTERLDVAGRHLTQRLIDLLVKRGYSFNRSADLETARMIKDKYCYVALDRDQEEKLASETTSVTETLTLPDGSEITLNAERFQCAEILFNPHILDHETPGIAELVFRAINKAPLDTREALYQHIVLSGGTTMLPGLPTRVENDLKNLYKTRIDNRGKMKIHVDAPPKRRHMVFRGGSVLADITRDNPEWWVTKQEYEANPNVLLEKCP